MLIVGDVKTFKSYLALNMSYDMAAGTQILGYWDVIRPLSVLYIEAEVGEFEVIERGEKIYTNKVDPTAYENLHIVSKDLRIQLDTPDGLQLLEQAIVDAAPDVVVLDPIVEFHSHDENKATEMKKMFAPIRKLMQKYHCALIVVHHTTKLSDYRPGNNPASARGSYLAGAANTILNVVKPLKKDDSPIVQIHFTVRAARAPKDITLKFDEETGGFK
jgi:RecA-family ATPase